MVKSLAKKGLGKAFKSWQDKRIGAMNRIVQKRPDIRGYSKAQTERFIEEYGEVTSSKAKSKKEYKLEQKKAKEKREKDYKGLPKP